MFKNETMTKLPSGLDNISIYIFAQDICNARTRRLVKILRPEFIHRGIFEWVGTHFSDINWAGAINSIQELKKGGSYVCGGVSGRFWEPDCESGPATVDEAKKNACSLQGSFGVFTRQINLREHTALEQLIYKAKKQIDAGVDGIEFDEYGMSIDETGDDPYIRASLLQIVEALKAYARETYGRNCFITVNSKIGGWDYPLITKVHNDGTEPVDYYLRNLPYRLIDDVTEPFSYDHYDGRFNFIPYLREVHKKVSPKPFIYWVDFCHPVFFSSPHRASELSNWLRISSAHVLASGGFPAHFRSYYENTDCLKMGIFQQVASLVKFMRENKELWHDLSWIQSQIVSCSASNVYMSAMGQEKRTLLHLVNGNYDILTQTIMEVNDFTVKLSLDSAPADVWMTTPDKPPKSRKTTLKYEYSDNVVTIHIPQLDVHNVIVIDQGSCYNPVYGPIEIKFPFPNPIIVPAGNKIKITAVATDGFDGDFDWYVNDIAGGDDLVGTVGSNGVYTAPACISENTGFCIKAVSRIDDLCRNELFITGVPGLTIPWSDTFNDDMEESIPANWAIQDGKGDWKVDTDGNCKVLHNYNISEGNGDCNLRETALYNAFITGGDQLWTDYEYSISVKPARAPVYYYGNPSGSFIGLVFRFLDSNNYYSYYMNADNKVRLFKTVNGTITEIGNAAEMNFIPEQKYTKVSIRVYKDNFRFFTGPQLIREDRDSSFGRGTIGLKASFVDCCYKDISVNQVTPFSSGKNKAGTEVCGNHDHLIETIIDECNDPTRTERIFEMSYDITKAEADAHLFGGDASRYCRCRNSNGQEWLTYYAKELTDAEFVTYFLPDEPISHFDFKCSSDNYLWTDIEPTVAINQGMDGSWHQVVYSIDNLPEGTNYIRILWNNPNGHVWTPQIGNVSIHR